MHVQGSPEHAAVRYGLEQQRPGRGPAAAGELHQVAGRRG